MKYIEIKLPRCLLYLTEAELKELLKHDIQIWKAALERGKAFQRNTTQRQREQAKYKAHAEQQELNQLKTMNERMINNNE